MNYTGNYQLRKPAANDNYSVDDFNFNADKVDAELAAREGLLKNRSTKDTPVDADGVPLIDSAASSATKRITWAKIKAALKTYFDLLYAAVAHTHTKSQITDFAHKASHKTGGADALTAADIGAAASSHSHAASNITSGTLAVARGGTGVTAVGGTDYTTTRFRGSQLRSADTNPTTNGTINWTYE